MNTSSRTQLLYSFALIAISTLVFMFYISLATQNHFSQLEPMLNGTASRPYVYRVLTPLVSRLLADTLDISPLLSVIFIMYLSLLGFSWSIWSLAKTLLPPPYAEPVTLLAPIGLIPFLFEQRHIYDFPTLFLFALALWFLAKGRFGAYLVVFFLATLSKETSLFLTLFFIIQFRNTERRYFLSLIFIQLVIYIFIRSILILLFQGNPGGLVEFHLYEHMDAYIQRPTEAILLLISIISLIGIFVIDRSEEIRFAQNALLAIGGPILVMYFFFGVPFEVRIFLEAYPAMFLVIAHAVIVFLGQLKNQQYSRTTD